MSKFTELLLERTDVKKSADHFEYKPGQFITSHAGENGRESHIHKSADGVKEKFTVKHHDEQGNHIKDYDDHTDSITHAHALAHKHVNSNEKIGAEDHPDNHVPVKDRKPLTPKQKLNMSESTEQVDEKIKVFAPEIHASGVNKDGEHADKVYDGKSRMADAHKSTEFGKSHRKAAADKIRDARKKTHAVGSRQFRLKNPNFDVYKEGTEQIDEVSVLIEYIDELEGRFLTEAMRKVGEYKDEASGRHATVHKNAEWGEHVVKFHTKGVHHKDADYHTSTDEDEGKKDAHDTAQHWVKNGPSGGSK